MNSLLHFVTETPFGTAFVLCLILALACWLVSLVTRESSWVDRLWSVAPPIYCLIVAVEASFEPLRVNIMLLLVVLWGARLTYNFVIKGGYAKGGEDYRWEHVRQRAGPVGFQIMNATVVSFGQLIVVWLTVAPIHQAWLHPNSPLNWIDGVAIVLFLLLFLGETIADAQMWKFQQRKKQREDSEQSDELPFLTTGLFKYSRHPNYFCEIAMWWVFYLFAIAASGQWLHWSMLGFILLTGLIVGSTRLTESISSAKYPQYRQYQESTPQIVPFTRIGRTRG